MKKISPLQKAKGEIIRLKSHVAALKDELAEAEIEMSDLRRNILELVKL